MERLIGRSGELPIEGQFPSLGGATEWLNSPPLDAEGLRGKVVVVDFCTYTCINWLRSLPYVRAWAKAYEDRGLVVIGVHTPEFSFEHDVESVRRALKEMEVTYPVVVDNDYAVWDAFANNYWPALYFIDAEGRIRHHRFGEGDYERSEIIIQQLLRDAGAEDVSDELAPVDPRGPEVVADWENLESPEEYLGSRRAQNFDSSERSGWGEHRSDEATRPLRRNHWTLSGNWTMMPEAVALNEANGRITFRFHARDVHLVMGPAAREMPVPFRVSIDGEPPGLSGGSDVDQDGSGLLGEQRMYQLIRQQGPIDDRTFEIEFLDRGAEAFVFTFG
ncbi:MAG TPA: thioredoxin family protein [Actinomycetota bacterium]|jgi:thiol-disulfide isomerase/thioredoxin|nr:thioredoxin family protein [Actinomycetota bacterium]